MDPLQWMGAVRMRVQTADKNIKLIYNTTRVSGLVSYKRTALHFNRCQLMDWSRTVDFLWIIVIFLSAVWTLILTAPIHCRGSIGEQVLRHFSKFIYILDDLKVNTFQAKLIFLVSYSWNNQNLSFDFSSGTISILQREHKRGSTWLFNQCTSWWLTKLWRCKTEVGCWDIRKKYFQQ